MRKIKFRAWDGEVMYYQSDVGDDFDFQVTETGFVLLLNEQCFETGSGVAEEYWQYIEKKGAIFSQFTGLKDCNGVDIYEGDILQNKVDPVLLNWLVVGVKYGFAIKNIFECPIENVSPFNLDSDFFFEDREVIGNIHQNKELMES